MDEVLELWENCLSLDEVIQEFLGDEDDSWKPVVQGFHTRQRGEEFLKEITEGRGEAEVWQCVDCEAVILTKENPQICSKCGLVTA